MTHAAVVGAGPAGLMAAETLARAGVSVTVYEAKPSLGRKFLMAGKSGLNLTKDEAVDRLIAAYDTERIGPMIRAFDAQAVKSWAAGLGQPVFTGSSGRVFPEAMKASPLLRAWLQHLSVLGVQFRTNWRWTGFTEGGLSFQTANGDRHEVADVSVLAMGGASWSRLGADGAWVQCLAAQGVPIVPFAPSNAALSVIWSRHMHRHFGQAIKAAAWTAGSVTSRGEAIVSERGLEGGGIYSVSRSVGSGAPLTLDLLPDMDVERIAVKLSIPRKKASWTTFLRKRLDLTGTRLALLQEWLRPLPDNPRALALGMKNLPVQHAGLRPMDEAISTAGGVAFDGLTSDLMLRSKPGVFCAGEMLDWDAPTGGYLINGCLATGQWAGRGAVNFLRRTGQLRRVARLSD